MIAALPLRDGRRALAGAALILAVALTAGAVVKLMAGAWTAFHDPFELDYGEGIVWWQMREIAAGRGYAPLGVLPAIVFHYPPVYHVVTACLTALTGADPLLAGRAVSVASALASVALIGRLAYAATPREVGRGPGLLAAMVAGCAFTGSPTVQYWSTLMRVDLLACALTLAGLWLTVRAVRTPSHVWWAALAFALAVYTKQTAVVGPAAAFAVLWVARPRTAWSFLAVCVGLGLTALAALQVETGGEFVRHVLLYNVNRFDPDRWRLLGYTLATQPITLALAAIAAGDAWRRFRRIGRRAMRDHLAAEPADAARLLALAYLLGRVATLPMVLKSGSSDNYLIDLFAAASVLVGPAVASVAAAALRGAAWPRPLLVALVLAGLPIQNLRLAVPSVDQQPAGYARLLAMVRKADRPVVSDDMVLLIRAGRPVVLEPAIVAELAHKGLYDEAALVRLIRARAFAFFVTAAEPDHRLFRERYDPPVAAAMADAYTRVERIGGLVVHLPDQTPDQIKSGGVASTARR